jgi:FK506-binding nuclear protein
MVPACSNHIHSRFEEVLEEDAKSKKRPRDSDAMEDVITAVVAGEEQLSKAQKKKLNKKLKATDGTAVAAGEPAADTPPAASASAAPSKKEKKKAAKDALKDVVKDAAKAGAKEGAKEVAKESAKESAKSKAVEELSSGVKMIDSKAGTGKTAKKGNTVSMRYIGKLQNGKVFDSNTKGKPVSVQMHSTITRFFITCIIVHVQPRQG